MKEKISLIIIILITLPLVMALNNPFDEGWKNQMKYEVGKSMSYTSGYYDENDTLINYTIKIGYPCEWDINLCENHSCSNQIPSLRQTTFKGFLGRSSRDGELWCYP